MSVDLHAAEARAARFTDTQLVVTLADGREIATPLDWYPRLRNASPTARQNFEVSGFGIHWPDLDEDLSVEGMLRGRQAAPAGS